MSTSAEQSEIVFTSWNIGHDGQGKHRLAPQIERLGGIITALAQWQEGIGQKINAASFYEVHGKKNGSSYAADMIADQLDLPNYEFIPNGNNGSGIMIAGDDQIKDIKTVVTDDNENRRAMIAYRTDGSEIVAAHPSHYPTEKGNRLRISQMDKLFSVVDAEEVIYLSDCNEPPSYPSRRKLEEEYGFEPAFEKWPKTFATNAWIADIGDDTWEIARPFVRVGLAALGGLALDGAYTKNLELKSASVIKAKAKHNGKTRFLSDHDGLGGVARRAANAN